MTSLSSSSSSSSDEMDETPVSSFDVDAGPCRARMESFTTDWSLQDLQDLSAGRLGLSSLTRSMRRTLLVDSALPCLPAARPVVDSKANEAGDTSTLKNKKKKKKKPTTSTKKKKRKAKPPSSDAESLPVARTPPHSRHQDVVLSSSAPPSSPREHRRRSETQPVPRASDASPAASSTPPPATTELVGPAPSKKAPRPSSALAANSRPDFVVMAPAGDEPIFCPHDPLFVADDMDCTALQQAPEITSDGQSSSSSSSSSSSAAAAAASLSSSSHALFAGSLSVASIPTTALESDDQSMSAALSRTRIFSHALLTARHTGQLSGSMFVAHAELMRDGTIMLFWSPTDRTVICSVPLLDCTFDITGSNDSSLSIVTADGQRFEFGVESAQLAGRWILEITRAVELARTQSQQHTKRLRRRRPASRVHTLYRQRRREHSKRTAEHRTAPTKYNSLVSKSASPSASPPPASSTPASSTPASTSASALPLPALPSSRHSAARSARKSWIAATPSSGSSSAAGLLASRSRPAAVPTTATSSSSDSDTEAPTTATTVGSESGATASVSGAIASVSGATCSESGAVGVDLDEVSLSDAKPVSMKTIIARPPSQPQQQQQEKRSYIVPGTGRRMSLRSGSRIQKAPVQRPTRAVERYRTASVSTLIQALWSEDEEFARVVLFTHPTFVSSRALWTLMRTQFNKIYPYGEAYEDHSVVDLVLHNRVRIIGIIHLWIEMGLMPASIEAEVVALVEKFGPVTLGLLPAITRELISWSKRTKAKLRQADLSRQSTTDSFSKALTTTTDSYSKALTNNDTPTDLSSSSSFTPLTSSASGSFDPMALFFKAFSTTTSAETFAQDQLTVMSPEELARCCCVAEFSAFADVPPIEYLAFVEDKSLAPTLNRFVELFNLRSRWLAAQILRQQNASHQLALIAKLARAADICRSLNNFSSVLMLTSSVFCPQVYSLFALLRQLPRDVKITLRSLGELMSPENGYKRYRQALKSVKKPPCVPYIGTVLRQLISIDECHSDTIDGSVHFTKRLYYYSAVEDVFKYRLTPYPFADACKESSAIFLDFFANPVAVSERDLDRLSAEVASTLPALSD